MAQWTPHDIQAITDPQEVGLATRRADGSLRSPRIIWIVRSGEGIFIRSTNGPQASWYRWALATGNGRISAGANTFDVDFTPVVDADELTAVDAAYRSKYGRYASIVDHLDEQGPRSATLKVTPGRAPQLPDS